MNINFFIAKIDNINIEKKGNIHNKCLNQKLLATNSFTEIDVSKQAKEDS